MKTVWLLVALCLAAGCANAPLPTSPAAPEPSPVVQPVAPPAPKPAAKVTVLFFTQSGCPPCRQLKTMLADPALRDVVARVDVQTVTYPDARFREYKVHETPTLLALTAGGPKRYPGGTLGQLANWLGELARHEAVGKFVAGGSVGPDGQEVVTDLPQPLRMKNVGGRDGAGLCVFTSISHSARWQAERRLWELQTDMRKEPGGGYPAKVDAMIARYGKGAPYIQYEGRDPAVLELALKTGRMPAVTYDGRDGVFYRSRIAHMVNLVYLDAHSAAILDNNNPDKILWMSRQEFLDRWTGGRSGWCVVLLASRPPAAPHNH
jgi:hypothetical protein